ncbi:hypothetical protein DFS34DRAFT_592584 [Phlyctochytrium arcticum]|nr:hypothetical protein DFS34DRAFT_592584 [Phlyctochytrium arcticum]
MAYLILSLGAQAHQRTLHYRESNSDDDIPNQQLDGGKGQWSGLAKWKDTQQPDCTDTDADTRTIAVEIPCRLKGMDGHHLDIPDLTELDELRDRIVAQHRKARKAYLSSTLTPDRAAAYDDLVKDSSSRLVWGIVHLDDSVDHLRGPLSSKREQTLRARVCDLLKSSEYDRVSRAAKDLLHALAKVSDTDLSKLADTVVLEGTKGLLAAVSALTYCERIYCLVCVCNPLQVFYMVSEPPSCMNFPSATMCPGFYASELSQNFLHSIRPTTLHELSLSHNLAWESKTFVPRRSDSLCLKQAHMA